MRYRFDKLAQYVRGWMGYFGISQYYRPIPELDEGARIRLRIDVCSALMNRPVRTRMPGGVGGAG